MLDQSGPSPQEYGERVQISTLRLSTVYTIVLFLKIIKIRKHSSQHSRSEMRGVRSVEEVKAVPSLTRSRFGDPGD